MAAAGDRELPPGDAELRAALRLLLAGERVEQAELVRGPRQPTLLELARHGDQALGGRGEIVAGRRAAPRVGAGAAVGKDAAREHEPFLVLGPQLGERLELLVLEERRGRLQLGLDVGLDGVGADERGVPSRTEEEADRLREDRLPRAGLAGDRVQARREVELGLADEDEILDPEPAQHGLDATPRSPPRRPARTAESPAPRPPGPRAPQGGWGLGTVPARRCAGVTDLCRLCADCVPGYRCGANVRPSG